MKNLFFSIFIFHFVCVSHVCAAQDRRIEEQKRDELVRTEQTILGKEKQFLWDFGGWIDTRHDDYKNIDNNRAERDDIDYIQSVDMRAWLKLLWRAPYSSDTDYDISFYLRVKDLLEQSRPDDTAGGSDHDGPHVDYAYLMLNYESITAQIGRSYYEIGSGLAYSDVHDGVSLEWNIGDVSFFALASHTLPNEHNIDTSIPAYEKQNDRYFYGAQVAYRGFENHFLYGFFLMQRDFSDEDPEDAQHQYTYDSEYWGIGANGYLLERLGYAGELVYETGKSYIYEAEERKDISAWAGFIQFFYYFDWYAQPRLSCEYGFGSGDRDRANVTDTFNGNTYGTDHTFIPFGYHDTGYVLVPQLSNIQYVSLGLECSPFEWFRFAEDFTVSVDFYRFWKTRASGGISDLDATANSYDVGSEIDVGLHWYITSDLIATCEYGRFFPGSAYPDSTNDDEQYLSFSMTLFI